MAHRDFHPGNILIINEDWPCISYIGSCEVTDETKIHGVMPYVAPEIFKGKPYTQAADIYSFGMIMYFVATGKQPFAEYAHDETLVLKICNGIRPETNAPKCYIDLMKKCLDSNPENRPNITKIFQSIQLFCNSYKYDGSDFEVRMGIEKQQRHHEIEMQFKEAENYRKANLLFTENDQSITHPQAIYTSRLLNIFNPFTKEEIIEI
jgi:serine/threonine protein kinase